MTANHIVRSGLALALLTIAAPALAADPAATFAAKEQQTKAALMANPQQALALSQEAERLAAAIPGERPAALAAASAKWMHAEALLGLNHAAAADGPAKEAAALIARAGPRTKLAGDIERTLGAIAGGRGDVQQALRRYQAAYRYFTAAGEARSRAMALLDIGQVYWDAGDYDRVLSYFGQAEELMPANDAGLQLALYNGRGEALRAMRRFGEAEREYAKALKAATALDSAMLQARILTNLANAQVLAGRPDAAARSVARGLVLARAPDVAEWRPYLLGAAARVAVQRGELALATSRLEQAFAGQDIQTTAMPFRELHEVAATLYQRTGNQGLAFAHLRALQRLDKEAQALIASNSAQLLAARFDFANLRRGQLERDIQIERQRTQFRTWLFSGLAVAGAIIFAILLTLYLSIRRSRDRLALSNTALGKALAAKTEFLATTSHEIRTPLNGILGMTQVMLANRAIDADVIDQIKVVHGAGEAMRALVDDILDVAKMETGTVETKQEVVVLEPLLRDAETMWRGHAQGKGIALKIDLAQAPAAIQSDGGRLRQIVANLLSNAVKFTQAGAVSLRCALEGDTLVIAVTDTGIGIPGDQLDAIFEPFHQVDGGMNRQFAGTGLGLAICRNLSAALGGSIGVESVVGAGSTFTLRLPYVAAAAPALAERPVTMAASRVLMVEANQLVQGVLRSVIEPNVASIAFAHSGDEAIAALGQADHLIIEARSSQVDGLDPLASLVRLMADARQAGLRTSILVAPSEDYPIGDIAELGADQLILKPISGAQLLARLGEVYAPSAELAQVAA